ncbi:hypothetical protein LKL81_22225 [Bacillus paranthracis]|uniref:hypothetical protein n=1 Tax=Bacillus TaxID=1386 RepID=UPI00027A038A|nr:MULTISPECIES: hypothetical protein [Bacillus]EJR15917.1 hypothetical protein II9_03053 [Bacillus cereus MSX-D12]KMP48638.1 hypothetical protein TU55_00640 [Bacillus cereus]KMP66708.1 hypothetical protein TU61_13160 [Bacillus cereus]MBE7117683.1 hypothetical protein [Bacillus paranthracis]MBE7134585.1 hypothetical protein [Bacillus paranthracis]
MSLLFDVIADIILFFPQNDMKLKHHIAKLSEFEWFRKLHEDTKYTKLIWSNRKIKKFILNSANMKALINSEIKQKEFVHLVHDEYKKRR